MLLMSCMGLEFGLLDHGQAGPFLIQNQRIEFIYFLFFLYKNETKKKTF